MGEMALQSHYKPLGQSLMFRTSQESNRNVSEKSKAQLRAESFYLVNTKNWFSKFGTFWKKYFLQRNQ